MFCCLPGKTSREITAKMGTIGLFDAVYLDLKKDENTLLMAVSEDFGGWLITGKFADEQGIIVN